MTEHKVDTVWQERPEEISWRCVCGLAHKHVPLERTGTPLRCADAHEPIEDWVPSYYAYGGRELVAVYCSCGHEDYNECPDRDREVDPRDLPAHRTQANFPWGCSTCDGGGCPDCTDPA